MLFFVENDAEHYLWIVLLLHLDVSHAVYDIYPMANDVL